MTGTQTLRMKSYIQPFERLLALRELEMLTGNSATPVDLAQGIWTAPIATVSQAGNSLAYWETTGEQYTAQVWREASGMVARNGVDLNEIIRLPRETIERKIPRSRCLRYGPHGIHEYRGKFFPQLVKAIINIAGVRGGTILDPMCGSGTTLVEAVCAGNHAIGIDMNPLSVFISNAKCDALRVSATEVVLEYHRLKTRLEARSDSSTFAVRDGADSAYMSQWFSADVLAMLDHIAKAITEVTDTRIAKLFHVSLSNIVRKVSYQKDVDLRVRKEINSIEPQQVKELFLAEALRTAKAIASDVTHGIVQRLGEATIHDGDARCFVTSDLVAEASIDLVITSPPYATALPYLDTDRLSLIHLGLLKRPQHRKRDGEMIGNREITERARRQQWDRYLTEGEKLPIEVRSLVEKIERENSAGTVGFRRRNLGALLATYFFDMRNVLSEIQRALKPGGQAFLVVGNNRTTTPAGEVEIETSKLLLKIAEDMGFENCERVEMEMLRSRDIFRENRTPSEHILSMRRQ